MSGAPMTRADEEIELAITEHRTTTDGCGQGQRHNGIIDDTLVSEQVFELDLDRLAGDPVDLDGVRIADEVTAAIRRHLARTKHPLKDAI